MNVLVDTSVWVAHYRHANLALVNVIEREKLYGLGCGFVDVALLTSACITPDARLWTLDKKLLDWARRFGVDFA